MNNCFSWYIITQPLTAVWLTIDKISVWMRDYIHCLVWGFSKLAGSTLDKVFLNYNRCALHVKATTCNAIVNGECGKFPPNVHCHINVLTYYHRLLTMSKGKVVKSVFKALHNLNDQGFQTWITRVSELARRYGIDINETASIGSVQFKSICSNMIKQNFVNK